MDNNYRPPGGDPGDHQPTEQFWHGQGTPPGGGQGTPAGSQDPGQHKPGLQAHLASDRRKALRWTAGIALAAVLVGGGVIAGIHLASPTLSTTPAASTSSTGNGSAGTAGGAVQTSQAALLNAALNAAGSPAAAATTSAGEASPGAPGTTTGPAGAGPAVGPCARAVRGARLARLAGRPLLARRLANAALIRCRFVRHPLFRFLLLHGIEGQFSFRGRTGTIRTLAYERGVIETLNSGSSIVVKAADGTTWTWDLVGNTVVREQGGVVSQSALSGGEQVWVGGPVVNGTKDARLIFINPPGGGS